MLEVDATVERPAVVDEVGSMVVVSVVVVEGCRVVVVVETGVSNRVVFRAYTTVVAEVCGIVDEEGSVVVVTAVVVVEGCGVVALGGNGVVLAFGVDGWPLVVARTVDCAIGTPLTNSIAIDWLLGLTLVHGVKKCEHNPYVKNVMLWHVAEAMQLSLHSSRVIKSGGDCARYTSPALVSHSESNPITAHGHGVLIGHLVVSVVETVVVFGTVVACVVDPVVATVVVFAVVVERTNLYVLASY